MSTTNKRNRGVADGKTKISIDVPTTILKKIDISRKSHSKYDLKVYLIWIPKYRKRVLTGKVAERTRDLLRQK